MSSVSSALMALSPLDGRYADKCEPIARFFSEFALIRARVRVEIAWLLWLAGRKDVEDCPAPKAADAAALQSLSDSFDLHAAEQVKKIESQTRHDVKAVEVHLANQLERLGLDQWIPWLHFGCTSEDINSVAYALLITGALHHVLAEDWNEVLIALEHLSDSCAAMPMLGRTHGQPASPTTMGKEMAVFRARLARVAEDLESLKMTAKFSGATGNHSAWTAAVPEADWPTLTREFLLSVAPECEPLAVTTQIDPHDSLAAICLGLVRLCAVLTDLARDVWQYISDGHFTQRPAPGQVGSSTMPHKVNPIDFENAEGNLGLAQALLIHLATKLPISRLQRDLTDSTVLRSVGVAFAHVHLALTSLLAGLEKIHPDAANMRHALEPHWELLAEPLQTCLRREGVADAYEKLRKVTQGQQITEAMYHELVKSLPLPKPVKERLAALRPETYLGRAADLARTRG